jgi:hypothetical protein
MQKNYSRVKMEPARANFEDYLQLKPKKGKRASKQVVNPFEQGPPPASERKLLIETDFMEAR